METRLGIMQLYKSSTDKYSHFQTRLSIITSTTNTLKIKSYLTPIFHSIFLFPKIIKSGAKFHMNKFLIAHSQKFPE